MSENTVQKSHLNITEEEFDTKFSLVASPQGSSVWEADEIADILATTPERVWTWVTGEDSDEEGEFEDSEDNENTVSTENMSTDYLVSGTHFVNRYGYGVTAEDVDVNTEYTVSFHN